MEERTKLRYERQSRGWSQEKAAEAIGVSRATVAAWEANKATPHPGQLAKLCEVYGKTLWELGFYEDESSHIPDEHGLLPRGFESFCTDLEFRVQCIIYEALSRQMSLHELRHKLTKVLALEEGSTIMDLERRKLLRHLALIPLQAFGLSAVGASRSYAPEDILIHCAAGITACEDLGKGIDLNLAYTAASAYIPALKSIAKNCPSQRKVASGLIAQAMLLLAALGLHVDGSKAAIGYAEQAVSYSEASSNPELVLTSLGQLAWIFSCDKQYRKALETAQQAEHLLKLTKNIHPLVQSNTYAVLGAYSAQNGRREEALTALNMATQMFFTTAPSNDYSYMDYDYSEIATTWGLAHARTGHPQEALNSFAEVIDPETLTAKMLVSERARIELLNHMALACVKSPTKDMEQTVKFWQAGMQGAKALQSEQRFSEALTTYEIMDGVWPGDQRIVSLRELVAHW